MVLANVPEFDIIGAEKFEDEAVGAIDPKAPDFVMLRMQLLSMERRMKWVFSEEIGLGAGFALNRLGKFLEQLIEGCGRRKFEHGPLVDQLP